VCVWSGIWTECVWLPPQTDRLCVWSVIAWTCESMEWRCWLRLVVSVGPGFFALMDQWLDEGSGWEWLDRSVEPVVAAALWVVAPLRPWRWLPEVLS
jgi:hypothetical protein